MNVNSMQAPFREGERGEIVPASVCTVNGRHLSWRESCRWVALLFLLCLGDALFTLVQVNNGASELNPLMDYLLKAGHDVFLFWKMTVTVLSLFVLGVYLPRYRWARSCFGALTLVYGCLCIYHLVGFALA